MTTPTGAGNLAALRVTQDGKRGTFQPDHVRFGDIAKDYAQRAGHMPASDGGQLARNARDAIERASLALSEGVGAAARVASDRTIYPDGRRDTIRQLGDAQGAKAAEHLERAEALVHVARAQFAVDALAKVPRSAETTARTDAEMLLRNVKPDELSQRMRQLAVRDDAVGALVASPWGRDYLASRGARTDDHDLVQADAINAAKTSGDPVRAAAAEAYGNVGHLSGAIFAVHQQARHATGDLATLMKAVRG
jgi:hypothetical protein